MSAEAQASPPQDQMGSIRVAAVMYAVTVEGTHALYLEGGRREAVNLGDSLELVEHLHELRDELRDTVALARGAVPRLDAFTREWGRRLLPASLLANPPDVVVFVPHASLHDIPLHLVELDSGNLLGVSAGVSYVSSRSMFARCAARNPARGAVPPIPADQEELPDAPVFVGGGVDAVRGDARFEEIPRRLAKWFDGTVLIHDAPYGRLGVKASTSGRRPTAVCIVAHGFLDQSNHRLSGLILDRWEGMLVMRGMRLFGEDIGFQDLPHSEPPPSIKTAASTEVLTVEELEVDAIMTTRLVLLLGCSAGSGRLLQADEPGSLAETFLHIGAASVIAPMWDTDVTAMLDWTDAFGAAWKGGMRPTALAFRDAFVQLRDQGYPNERLGALTVRGDWL